MMMFFADENRVSSKAKKVILKKNHLASPTSRVKKEKAAVVPIYLSSTDDDEDECDVVEVMKSLACDPSLSSGVEYITIVKDGKETRMVVGFLKLPLPLKFTFYSVWLECSDKEIGPQAPVQHGAWRSVPHQGCESID
jgi:hypothetical protein